MAITGFKARLRKAIRESGLTVTAAAVKIGCSRISLHNWLAGRTMVSPAYEKAALRFIEKFEG